MVKRRVPNEVLEARGSFERNKKKYADRVENAPVKNGPLGDAPVHLSPAARATFEEIARAVPAGVAWASDRIVVELAALLLAEVRSAPLTTPAARFTRLQSLLASLGMSPTDRAKVSVRPAPAPAPAAKDTSRFFKH